MTSIVLQLVDIIVVTTVLFIVLILVFLRSDTVWLKLRAVHRQILVVVIDEFIVVVIFTAISLHCLLVHLLLLLLLDH